MNNSPMNTLILACGTRNKIVQYMKRELAGRGKVIAADCSALAPALYDADEYVIVKRINESGYLEQILDLCVKKEIRAVFSLIDPELSLLAQNRQAFLDVGTIPLVSDYDAVERCFDKFAMFRFLTENGLPTVRSYIDKAQFYSDLDSGLIRFPVFVKPVNGSASKNINKVKDRAELEWLLRRHNDLMIQEYMDGTEFGVDTYIDMISGEPVSIFIKEKIKMRAGETDKSVSVKDNALFSLVTAFLEKSGLRGVLDIDVFKVGDNYFISEINPRFGGGYPHAYECGINFPKMIYNNLEGKCNPPAIGAYEEGVYMMKYNEVMVIRG